MNLSHQNQNNNSRSPDHSDIDKRHKLVQNIKGQLLKKFGNDKVVEQTIDKSLSQLVKKRGCISMNDFKQIEDQILRSMIWAQD